MDTHRSGRPSGSLVFFPGALGDFLCFLPTLLALRRIYPERLCLVANPAWTTLLGVADIEMVPLHRREVADLFASGGEPAAATRRLFGDFARARSWTGHGDPNFPVRLAQLCEDTHVLPFRDFQPGERAAASFARSVGLSLDVEDETVLSGLRRALRRDDAGCEAWLRQRGLDEARLLVLHPGSGSWRKNWQGYGHLVESWRKQMGPAWRIIELAGPAESETPSFDGCVLRDAPLPLVAALLARADLYAGNDSGISHLAGIVGAPGVVLFGSTDPVAWRPLGNSLTCVHRPEPCDFCPDRFCEHRLPAAEVVEALQRGQPPGQPACRSL